MSKVEKRGEIIKRMRQIRGMSKKELAGKLKCSKEIIRLWEHGKRKPNKQHTLELYRLLGVASGEDLINEDMGMICNAGSLGNKSEQLTIYKKRNQIHLRKEFLEQIIQEHFSKVQKSRKRSCFRDFFMSLRCLKTAQKIAVSNKIETG